MLDQPKESWNMTALTVNSDQSLINLLYLTRGWLMISILYFVLSVPDNLPQFSIEQIGFTLENIL